MLSAGSGEDATAKTFTLALRHSSNWLISEVYVQLHQGRVGVWDGGRREASTANSYSSVGLQYGEEED